MILLGDAFPEHLKESNARDILKTGAVLRLYSSDINNPKIKRLIIISGIGSDGLIGKVYINTRIQAPSYQLELKSNGRPYLEHDSYVDCSRIYSDKYSDVLEKVKSDLSCVIGDITIEDMAYIFRELREAKTISKNDKVKFGIIKTDN